MQEHLSTFRDQSLLKTAIDLISGYVPYFFYASHWDRMKDARKVNGCPVMPRKIRSHHDNEE